MLDRLRQEFWPLVRFGLVGVANTGVYYVTYLILLLALPYVVAHLLAWAVSMTFSYLLNCWFTYRVKPTWGKFIRFPLASLPNVLFTTFGVVLLVEWLGVSDKWAPLIAGLLAVPFSYLFAKWLLVGTSRGESHDQEGQQSESAHG